MSEIVERQRRARAIFESVHELAPDTRAAAVADACGGDAELRREVLELLEAAGRMGSFLQNGIASASAPTVQPGDRIGPYEVIGLLATGGMGDVYRARDTNLGRDVALKLLPDAFLADPDRITRFGREARILASLNHPHIATIHGLEEVDGVGALVLELIPGPTLAERIAAGPLPLNQALHIARQLVDALDAAHRAGIVHRDLKPANITVNAILPGIVAGPRMTGVIDARAKQVGVPYEEMEATYLARVSLRRMVSPNDVAAMALFLVSPQGRNISGQSLGVDGNVESL